jgi:hypothetical protein
MNTQVTGTRVGKSTQWATGAASLLEDTGRQFSCMTVPPRYICFYLFIDGIGD